jgi:host factor-I protein
MITSEQNKHLNNLRANKIPVDIFMMNGVRLSGLIDSFDNLSVALSSKGDYAISQMLMKTAISTVQPSGKKIEIINA